MVCAATWTGGTLRPCRLLLVPTLLRLALGQIRVMAPESLVKQLAGTNGRIEGSTATFGAPFYGQRLLGRLIFAESEGENYCTEGDYTIPKADKGESLGGEARKVQLINIVVVLRGNCTFVRKVRVAQGKGAHAVIIVDNQNLTTHDIRRIIVADDGYGQNVEIPSMLVATEEGNYLVDAVRKSDKVIVELAWDIPTDHVVLVDLWMSSASQESLKFLRDWSPRRKELNDAIKFVPHYAVFGMQESTDYNDLCTDKDASYCAEDPDGSGDITGKMVLEEDVRQLCIHEKYKISRDDIATVGASNKVEYAREYWDYVEKMLEECPIDGDDAQHKFGEECSKRLMGMVGIDYNLIRDCAANTADQKLEQQRLNVAWSPRALRINGWRYSGQMDADLVTRAICAGFVHQPPACVRRSNFALQQPSGGITIGSFVGSLFLVACLALAALMFYKRSLTRHIHSALREEVMLEVQAQMDSYKQLS